MSAGDDRGGVPSETGGRRASRRRPTYPERPCQNCGDPASGEYCPSCGQRKVDVAVSLPAMVANVLEDELLLGRRLPRTLSALLLRPGLLTQEFVRGRIVRYIRPLKLYLVSSVLFFLLLSFVTLRAVERVQFGVTGEEGEGALVVGLGPGAPHASAADAGVSPEATIPSAEPPVAPTDSATGGPPDEGVDSGARTLGWLDAVTVNSGNTRVDAILSSRLERLARMEPSAAAQELVRTFLSYGPTALFVLLPLFAGVLKLLYLRSGRFYAEHVVFLLHLHAFVFVVFMVLLLTWSWLPGLALSALLAWVLAYGFLAVKRVYGQGWFVTALKYWTLGWAYVWLLAVSVPLLLVATFLLLPG